MDDQTQSAQVRWTSAQAYAFAVVCLVVGIACGYLLHGPAKVTSQETSSQSPAAPISQGVTAMPTSDQLKHMGDKMAAPLVAELQKYPNNPELLAKIASVYFRAQQFSLAAENYEKSVSIKPTVDGYVSLSNAYHYAGADDKAFVALDKALGLDPKSANALFNQGMLEWQVKNDPQAAIASWERLLKSNPNHPRRAQVEGMIAKAKKHISMPSGNTAKSEM